MNSLMYLNICSFKNRFLEAVRSPKLLAKALIMIFMCLLFVVSAIVGVSTGGLMEPLLLKGVLFVLFLLPYWAGRFGGVGSFGMEDVNFVFTAPILPRTVLLAGLWRRFSGMLVISFAVVIVLFFFEVEFMYILIAGIFCFVLTVVCKLLGMYMFVAYRKVYRWIGFFGMALLLGFGVFYVYRAGWEWMPGILGLLDSYVFAFTPLVGWAVAGAFSFMTGQMLAGLIYLSLLLAAGGYFFWTVYRSSPDFYDELLGVPAIASDIDSEPVGRPLAASKAVATQKSRVGLAGTGAAVFFHKHVREISRISWAGVIGSGTLWGMALAVIWGLYARDYDTGIEFIAHIFGRMGIPSGNILAVLVPLVIIMAAYPQFDHGFLEMYNPYFYLVPEPPRRKLLWVSMVRIVKVCVMTVLVLGPAGVISRTAPSIVLAAMLAYLACAFMVLGLRLAMVRLLGVVSGARQKLVSTLPVMFFVGVGLLGVLVAFFFGPEDLGLLIGLLGFAGWCTLVGGMGFGFSLRVLHDVDAPV